MINTRRLADRSASLVAVVAFGVALVASALLPTASVSAAGQFTPRKLTMSSQASGSVSTDANGTAYVAGDGGNGARSTHTFNFTAATSAATIGSVLIQYCTTPFFGTACTMPTGMDATNVTAVSLSNFAATAPTLDATTDAVVGDGGIFATEPCSGAATEKRENCILLKRASGTLETGTPAYQVIAGNGATNTSWVKNPTSVGTFYVRISTFSDIAYTTIIDQGAVTGSVNATIDITAKVQEKLNFSVSATKVAQTAACTALSGSGAINLGDVTNGVLDTATAYFNHSYWRINTNAANGTLVKYSGDTLKTSGGTNDIDAIGGTATASATGTEQFGLGLDSTDTTTDGYTLSTLDSFGVYGGAGGTTFAFLASSKGTPINIASQTTPAVIPCETGSVKYVGNISTLTKAGVYKTSIAYIAVPTY